MAQTLIPSRSPGDSDWLPPSSQALPKESEFEDSPSQSEDYVVDDTKEEDLYRWSQTAPEGQKLEDVNSPTKKPALRKPSPSGFYITTRLRPYSENTEPSTLKQLNHYVRKHEFFTKLSLARFTTSHRRKFERDIYDFGRSLGLSKSKVEEELVKARSFCGEEFYDSDHSAWADEIDDSSTVLKRLSCPSKSTSPNNGVVQSAEAKDLTQSTTSNKSRNLCQLSTAGRNDRSQEQQNTINKKQKNPGEKTHISVPPVAKGASIEVIKRKKRKSFEADMANDKIKDYPAKKRQQKGVQYAQGYRDEQVVPYVKPPGLVQSTNKPTLTSNGLNSNDKVAFAGIVIAKIPTHQIRSLDVVDELLNIDSALLDEPLVSSQSPALAAQPCEREEEKISADVKKISPEFNSRVKRRNRKQVKTLKGTKTSQKPKEQEVNPKEDHSITSLILPASEIPKISGPKVRSHEGLHIYGNQGQDPTSQKPSGVVWTSQEHRNLYSELEWKKGTLKVSLSNEVVGVGGATPDRNLAKDRSVWGENIVKLGCSKDSNQEQLPASQNGSAITGRGKREKRNPKKGTEVEGGNNRKGKTKKAKATHSGLPEISIQNKENLSNDLVSVTAADEEMSRENKPQVKKGYREAIVDPPKTPKQRETRHDVFWTPERAKTSDTGFYSDDSSPLSSALSNPEFPFDPTETVTEKVKKQGPSPSSGHALFDSSAYIRRVRSCSISSLSSCLSSPIFPFTTLPIEPKTEPDLSLQQKERSKPISLAHKPKALRKLTISPYFIKSPSKRVKGAKISSIPFPPLDAISFGLVQESLSHAPFLLLIAVIFLNKTRGSVAMPVFYNLIARYPTPTALAAAKHDEIVSVFQQLGLQNQRALRCVGLAKTWLETPPVKGKRYRRLHYPAKDDGKDIDINEGPIGDDDGRVAWEVGHLAGIGAYAIDSWRIFCRDELRGLPTGLPDRGELMRDSTIRKLELAKEWTRVLPLDKELRAYLRWRWLRIGFEWDPISGERKVADEQILKEAAGGGVIYEGEGVGSLEGTSVGLARGMMEGGQTPPGIAPGLPQLCLNDPNGLEVPAFENGEEVTLDPSSEMEEAELET